MCVKANINQPIELDNDEIEIVDYLDIKPIQQKHQNENLQKQCYISVDKLVCMLEGKQERQRKT